MGAKTSRKLAALPKAVLDVRGGVVILSLKEYKRLLENSVPAVYLKGRKAAALDRLVTEGLQEHAQGRTRRINSLADLDQ